MSILLTPGITPRLRSRPVAGSADKKYFCECAVDQPIPKKRLASALKRRPWTFVNERWDTREWLSAVCVNWPGGDGKGGSVDTQGGGDGEGGGGVGSDGGDGQVETVP